MNDHLSALSALLDVMARLRDPEHGCPWDREQTFATIAPYTLEEAYEVAEAIESGDPHRLRDELGDLLFQVVFHSRMAQERGWFDFADVASAIHDKLVRRHPHVFANVDDRDPATLSERWEEEKERERAERARSRGEEGTHTLDDVPRALPALTRAAKLGKRAARVGFDWPDAKQVRTKLSEELRELDAALSQGDAAHAQVAEELGDVLFTVVNLSRHLHVDPEDALRRANAKFEQRFRRIEALARDRGRPLRDLSAEEWDALWEEAKADSRASGT